MSAANSHFYYGYAHFYYCVIHTFITALQFGKREPVEKVVEKVMTKTLFYIVLALLYTVYSSCEMGTQRIQNKQKSNNLTEKCIVEFIIDDDIKLCYLSKSSYFEDDLYERPRIITINGLTSIEGIDEMTGTGFMSVSPNKKYLMLYKIGFSFIFEDSTKFYEKYSHLIVDINQHEVVQELYAKNCDGFWSEQDEWINAVDSSIIFPNK